MRFMGFYRLSVILGGILLECLMPRDLHFLLWSQCLLLLFNIMVMLLALFLFRTAVFQLLLAPFILSPIFFLFISLFFYRVVWLHFSGPSPTPLLVLVELVNHFDNILQIIEWLPSTLGYGVTLPLYLILQLACVRR